MYGEVFNHITIFIEYYAVTFLSKIRTSSMNEIFSKQEELLDIFCCIVLFYSLTEVNWK